jgi:hypothetical protein
LELQLANKGELNGSASAATSNGRSFAKKTSEVQALMAIGGGIIGRAIVYDPSRKAPVQIPLLSRENFRKTKQVQALMSSKSTAGRASE